MPSRTDVQERYNDLIAEVTSWQQQFGHLQSDQVPPSAREQAKTIEQDVAYYSTLLKFYDHVLRVQGELSACESLCERKYFFLIDDLLDWLLAQPQIHLRSRSSMSMLNDLLSQTQNARDALADRYEAILFLTARYEEHWTDIQQLWISFNDAKSQDRAVGKLLQTNDDALALKERLSQLRALKSAMEVEWRHILQNSVEIRAQADMITESSRGGIGGLPVDTRRAQEASVYDRPSEPLEEPTIGEAPTESELEGFDL
jgi:hypothetical protein